MPVIDLGKVVGDPGASMRFRGEWNGGAEYFNNASYVDTVTHHGSLWVCKQTNTGQEPIEGDYWGIGAQGNSDLNASDVTYDNESSGLSSNTAQGAIDEIVEIEKVINGNQADLYSPDETYTAGRLVIKNNALWKAKQDINVAEAWTPEHWELTTLAAELSAVNSSTSLQLSEYIVLIHSGNVVHIDIYITPTTYSVGWNTIGTIPEELRPGLNVQVVAMDNGASSREDSFPIQLRITTSGDINAYIWPSHLTAQIYGNVTYIIP